MLRRDFLLPALLGLGLYAQNCEINLANNTTILLLAFFVLTEEEEHHHHHRDRDREFEYCVYRDGRLVCGRDRYELEREERCERRCDCRREPRRDCL